MHDHPAGLLHKTVCCRWSKHILVMNRMRCVSETTGPKHFPVNCPMTATQASAYNGLTCCAFANPAGPSGCGAPASACTAASALLASATAAGMPAGSAIGWPRSCCSRATACSSA
jgi:hypothetical protein